jgi:hypothetical protein
MKGVSTSVRPIPVDQSTPQQVYVLRERSPLVLWHLLSCDAPTVAVLWTIFIARLTHTPLGLATPAALALAVWTLYAADRLLDTRHLLHRAIPHPDAPDLEPRHLFHHRHRTLFHLGVLLATLATLALLPRLAAAQFRLYLLEAAFLAAYLALTHAASFQSHPHPSRFTIPSFTLPKELLVGPFFAAATFIPTVARSPSLRLLLLPHATLFALLCTLNCLFIYAWEHPHEPTAGPREQPHWTTLQAIRRLPLLTALLLAAASILCLTDSILSPTLTLYPIACLLSTLILFALHRSRLNLSRLTLRAAADAALLTPLLLLPLVSAPRLH